MTQSHRDDLDSVELNPMHNSTKVSDHHGAVTSHGAGGHGHDIEVSYCA